VTAVGGAAIVVITVSSRSSSLFSVTATVDADLIVNTIDSAPCTNFYDLSGFSAYGNGETVSFFFKGRPLVTDASSYWFGLYSTRESNRLTQIYSESYSGDSGMAASWQNRYLSPYESASFCFVVRWGSESGPPVLSMPQTSFPAQVPLSSSIRLQGSVSDPDGDTVAVYACVRNGSMRLVRVVQFRSPGSFDVYVENLFSQTGQMTIDFWAIDSTGTVAREPATFDVFVGDSGIATPVPARTPRDDPYLKMSVSKGGGYANFDLSGRKTDFSTLQIADGFFTIVAVDGFEVEQKGLAETSVGRTGVRLSAKVVPVGPAAVIVFTLANANSADKKADLSLYTPRIRIGEAGMISCADSGDGITVLGGGQQLTFTAREAPFVTDVSAYWFGHYFATIDNLYAQVVSGSSYSDASPGVSLSWKEQTVPAGGSIAIATILSWGGSDSIPDISKIYLDGNGNIAGMISTQDESLTYLFFVIDGNASSVVSFGGGIWPNEEILLPMCTGVPPGSHKVLVYAVGAPGGISEPIELEVTCEGTSQRTGETGGGETLQAVLIPLAIVVVFMSIVWLFLECRKKGEDKKSGSGKGLTEQPPHEAV
jgi:hypothetical protein